MTAPATRSADKSAVDALANPRVLRIATRSSALALAQARTVADALSTMIGVRTELVAISTDGDRSDEPLDTFGGTGVFVTAVRAALLTGDVDLAVHSLKDLPTAPADGIALAAVPTREDPLDALCARDQLSLATLPPGATVGTGSPRRTAMLRRRRPDLNVVPIRGNVDTRLAKVAAGELDAVVVAAAGLHRLGRGDAVTDLLDGPELLPAPGQGALAVECRLSERQSAWFASALARLDEFTARAEVTAERNLLATLQAGCSAPVGARARVHGQDLTLTAIVLSADGADAVTGEIEGAAGDAAKLGRQLGEQLLRRGAAALIPGTAGSVAVTGAAG